MAILEKDDYNEVNVPYDEIKVETTRGTGAGGQHRNSTDSCVVLTHIPTGIKVARNGRCQHKNKADAIKELNKRVNNYHQTGFDSVVIEERRTQIGNGERSEKRRTYRVKENQVIDHITNKTSTLKDIFKGRINLLH